MGIFSSLFGAVKSMRAASRLIDAARAGDAESVHGILATDFYRRLHPRNKAEFLGVGLIEAASEGHEELVDLLVKQGADLDSTHPASGDTALTLAAFRGQDAIVRRLVSCGANINRANRSGITPLMLAAGKCDATTIQFLLENGVNTEVKSPEGIKAHNFAEMEGRHDVATLLKE